MRVSVCACAGADLAEGMLRAGAACHFSGSWPHGRRELWSCEPSRYGGPVSRIATAASCRRTRRGCGRPGRGFRTSRLCGSLSLSFFARSACLLRATWVVSLRVGRAPAAAGGSGGGGQGRGAAGARRGVGLQQELRLERGGGGGGEAGEEESQGCRARPLCPPPPALSIHSRLLPELALPFPPPSGMRSALFSAALQRGFPRLRPPHSFMFFLLATVFTLFDRVLFLHLVVYISFPKEWLLTPPCRYGAVVFDNNHFSTSDLNVGWTARVRGWRLQNRVAQSCYRLGICIFYICAWEADGGSRDRLTSRVYALKTS